MQAPQPQPERSEPESFGDLRLRTVGELREFLAERSAEQAVGVLFRSDALELKRRVLVWQNAHWYLLDRRRFFEKSVAMIVNAGPGLTEDDDLDEWLDHRIEDSAWALMMEEAEAEKANEPLAEPLEPRYQWFHRQLGIEMSRLRRAAVAFNGLPSEQREAAYMMVVQRLAFGDLARKRNIDAREARDRMVAALRRIGEIAKEDPSDE